MLFGGILEVKRGVAHGRDNSRSRGGFSSLPRNLSAGRRNLFFPGDSRDCLVIVRLVLRADGRVAVDGVVNFYKPSGDEVLQGPASVIGQWVEAA